MKLYANERSRAAGFSLIEVIVVLLLISILSMVVMNRDGGSNARLVGETDKLRGHLRFAQILGMANNTDRWTVEITTGGYGLEKNGTPAAVSLPASGSADYQFPSGIRVTEGAGSIHFDEWGSPGNSTLVITLSDGSYSSTITIDTETGHQS
jgi:prepilin-type N-terminal cleavage/methylation domain-containing protein